MTNQKRSLLFKRRKEKMSNLQFYSAGVYLFVNKYCVLVDDYPERMESFIKELIELNGAEFEVNGSGMVASLDFIKKALNIRVPELLNIVRTERPDKLKSFDDLDWRQLFGLESV